MLEARLGVQRIKRNAYRLAPLPLSTGASLDNIIFRLFRLKDRTKNNAFGCYLSNMTVSGFGGEEPDGSAILFVGMSVIIVT
jgi:hypothetical protein